MWIATKSCRVGAMTSYRKIHKIEMFLLRLVPRNPLDRLWLRMIIYLPPNPLRKGGGFHYAL
ncbi:hypothetical protein [Campylobacter troglodytis]|uniref:hypothetical protein n=1 Tax=Campylobacter troglodytis TaxID=654363 RepID=UPI00115732C2|nr:hypothetical protein [Campylobacter troglodytis]